MTNFEVKTVFTVTNSCMFINHIANEIEFEFPADVHDTAQTRFAVLQDIMLSPNLEKVPREILKMVRHQYNTFRRDFLYRELRLAFPKKKIRVCPLLSETGADVGTLAIIGRLRIQLDPCIQIGHCGDFSLRKSIAEALVRSGDRKFAAIGLKAMDQF